jgi:hypothetical protein
MGYRNLYKRTCDFTGEQVITFYHPSEPHKIYRQDIWWSDKWDPKEYGRDYDFSRSFFEQFFELFREVPKPALQTQHSTMINSDYCNGAAQLKNCYLCFQTDIAENSAYTRTITGAKETLDSSFSNYLEFCYEVLNTNKSSRVFYSQDCIECYSVYFSKDLVGCTDCIGCVNLRGKSYYIFNEPHTKEEYEKFLVALDFGSTEKLNEFKKQVKKFMLTQPRRATENKKSANVSGDYILHSKNVRDSYMMSNAEDIHYSQFLKAGPVAQCYDYSIFGNQAEWIYESLWVGLKANNIRFSFWNYGVSDLEYCIGCHGSQNLFGCVGIRNGEYCVFNKQYSKSEYAELVSKIKEQSARLPYKDALGREYKYGEFFPPEMSPWPYNESTAQEFFSTTKENAVEAGFRWRDPDKREYQTATMEIPDHIRDVGDDILQAVLTCENCGKNYKIVNMELQFYRKFNIPIPRFCPQCRDQMRISLLNPIRTYHRRCGKCQKEVESSYDPTRPEIIYCEQCYNAEVD